MTEEELYSLERIVSAYLDLAEDRARRHIPMTMADWAERLDIFLMADDRESLTNAGMITAETAKAHAESEFERCQNVAIWNCFFTGLTNLSISRRKSVYPQAMNE